MADPKRVVTVVTRGATHTMTKATEKSIHLVAGIGVEGDAHQGSTVKHRSRAVRDPNLPNLRQVAASPRTGPQIDPLRCYVLAHRSRRQIEAAPPQLVVQLAMNQVHTSALMRWSS